MAKQKKIEEVTQPKKKTGTVISPISVQWYSILILIFSFTLYFNSVFNDYNLDDELVTQNHRLTSKGISAIPEIFKSPYFENKEGFKYEYRPIVLVSFAIENSLFGDNAHTSHFINVLLYSLLCVLLFLVLRNLLHQYNLFFSFIITLLFVAHPIHTEVVASIKNRDEILSLTFGLLSLHFAIYFVRHRKMFELLLIPAFFLLSILSKSTTITFALLIPISLMLFTKVNLKTLLLITAVLAIPAFFYSRLYSVYQQLGLVLALFVAVTTFYYLRNFEVLSKSLKAVVNQIRKLILVRTTTEEKTSSSLDFSFLKNRLNLLASVLTVLLTVALTIAGIYTDRLWLTIIPMFVLAFSFMFMRDELKAILITPIVLVTLLALIQFNITSSLMEAGLVVFLALQILSKNKTFRIIGIVNYILFAVVSLFIIHSTFFLIIFIFAIFYHKKLFPITLFVVLASGAILFKHGYFLFTGVKAFKLVFLNLPFLYASFLFLWRQHSPARPAGGRLLSWVAVISIPVFILLHSIFTPPVFNKEREERIQKTYTKINTLKALDATPVQSLRPIAFMECPVDKDDPLTIKSGTAMVVLGKYLKLIFVPYPMSYYYGYAYITPTIFFSFVPVLIFVLHLLLFILGIFYLPDGKAGIRKIPVLSFAILFYLVSISVFSNLVIRLPGMMGDRFLLIPSIGFCVFLAFLAGAIFKQDFTDTKARFSSLQMPLRILLGVILVLYSALTFSRNADWKDRITLFSHDINAVENSAQAQNLLGLHLLIESKKETDGAKQKQMREEAAVHLKKALEIYPKFLNASFDLARTYEALQRSEEAYVYYANSLKIDSSFVAACFGMAVIQQNKGNLETAIPLYEKFLTKYPEQMEVYANMSYAYFKLGQYDSSISVNKRALVIKPNTFEPVVNIAKTYLQINRRDSALVYFVRALQINPSDANTANSISALKEP